MENELHPDPLKRPTDPAAGTDRAVFVVAAKVGVAATRNSCCNRLVPHLTLFVLFIRPQGASHGELNQPSRFHLLQLKYDESLSNVALDLHLAALRQGATVVQRGPVVRHIGARVQRRAHAGDERGAAGRA